MSKYYAMGDIHGCLDVFEQALSVVDLQSVGNRLFLLGDYVPHCTAFEPERSFLRRSERVLRRVKGLCEEWPGQVVALKGNHELDMVEQADAGLWRIDAELVHWMRDLPLFHETERQIFVHAGVDEDAGDLWKWGTDEIMFCCKYPPSFGPFLKDVVAGHVGTWRMHGRGGGEGGNGAYWDGQSHYYLDGTTEKSGVLPVLIYDTDRHAYSSRTVTAGGVSLEDPLLPPMS